MKIEKVIQTLTDHNKWRRGDDTKVMAEPKVLGEALEKAIEYLDKYRVAVNYKFINDKTQ